MRRALNEKNRYKLKNAISSSDKKVFVLIQSWIQREYIDDWEQVRDLNEIVSISWRLLNLFKKFFFKKKQPRNLIMTIKLSKFISNRTWENSSLNQLRQVILKKGKLNKIFLLSNKNKYIKKKL